MPKAVVHSVNSRSVIEHNWQHSRRHLVPKSGHEGCLAILCQLLVKEAMLSLWIMVCCLGDCTALEEVSIKLLHDCASGKMLSAHCEQ